VGATHPISLSLFILPAFELFGHQGAAALMLLLMCAAATPSFLVADSSPRGRRGRRHPFPVPILPAPLLLTSHLPETMRCSFCSFGYGAPAPARDRRTVYAGLMGLSSA